MPEIMSPKQLARSIVVGYGQHECEYLNIPNLTGIIGSRDSAIIEKCKESIRNMSTGGLIGEAEAIAILDSVLSDINGGK
jgi:hypothetical protein